VKRLQAVKHKNQNTNPMPKTNEKQCFNKYLTKTIYIVFQTVALVKCTLWTSCLLCAFVVKKTTQIKFQKRF